MAHMPAAVWRPVDNMTPAGSVEQRGLVLHVQQGDNSPFGWFNDEESEASSDFWVAKDGRTEQYVNTGVDRAWAQVGGNAYYASVETEGFVGEPLTAAQMMSVAEIYAWGHRQFGWPLVVIDSTTGHGFTWHGAGGAAWGGHTGCPGDIRKAQRQHILDLAAKILGEPASWPQWPGVYLRSRTPMQYGPEVRAWQQRMRDRGWTIAVDGWYGPKSDRVCRAFQADKNLEVDGIVGRQTWDAAWTAPVT